MATAVIGANASSSEGEMRGWLPLGAFNSLAAAAAEGSGKGAKDDEDDTAPLLHADFPPGAAVAALVRVAVE